MERKNRKSGSIIFYLTLTPVQQGTRRKSTFKQICAKGLFTIFDIYIFIQGVIKGGGGAKAHIQIFFNVGQIVKNDQLLQNYYSQIYCFKSCNHSRQYSPTSWKFTTSWKKISVRHYRVVRKT